MMKKFLITLALLFTTITMVSQAKQEYRRYGKRTSAEIAAINTSRTDVIYTAYNTTLGYEVINKSDGNGWVQRFVDETGTDDQNASEVPITDTGENFTATDVEGALAELVNNGGGSSNLTVVTEGNEIELEFYSGTTAWLDTQPANTDPNVIRYEVPTDVVSNGGLGADEISYDNTTSGLTSTDTQEVIDELDSKIQLNVNNISLNANDLEDNQDRIDSVVTFLNAPSRTRFIENRPTGSYTFVLSDANDDVVVPLDGISVIPENTFWQGDLIRVEKNVDATGDVRVIEGNGVDIINVADGFDLDDDLSYALIRCIDTVASPEKWKVSGHQNITDFVGVQYTAGTNEFPAMVGNVDSPDSTAEWPGEWAEQGSGTHGVETTIVRSGTTSLSVSGLTETSAGVRAFNWNPTGQAANKDWRWEGFVYIPTGVTKAELNISDATAGPSTINLLTLGDFVNDNWFWFSLDHAQQNTSTFSMQVTVNNGTIYLDDMKWINITPE